MGHDDGGRSGLGDAVLAGTLLVAMFASTFPQFALGVLGPVLVDEMSIRDGTLGAVTASLYVVATVVARLAGRRIDGLGGRTSLLVLYSLAVMSLLLLAGSQSVGWLVGAAVLAGASMGINNPVTNRLIALHASPRRRGRVVGVKQTGVKVSHLAAGATLPWLAQVIGWRQGLVLVAVGAGTGALLWPVAVPRAVPRGGRDAGNPPDRAMQVELGWLRLFAVAMAVGVAAINTYLPLYAVDRVGMSLAGAGAVVTVFALTATAARLVWASVTDRLGDPTLVLLWLSGAGAAGLLVVAAAETSGPVMLWLASIWTGVTTGSWNVVAHVTVVREAHGSRAAAASGYMQSAFFLGLAIGAPVFGVLVETTGGYSLAWVVASGLAAFAFVVVWRERRRRGAAVPDAAGTAVR
jgi:predicted MFS family arabinose efflux permease